MEADEEERRRREEALNMIRGASAIKGNPVIDGSRDNGDILRATIAAEIEESRRREEAIALIQSNGEPADSFVGAPFGVDDSIESGSSGASTLDGTSKASHAAVSVDITSRRSIASIATEEYSFDEFEHEKTPPKVHRHSAGFSPSTKPPQRTREMSTQCVHSVSTGVQANLGGSRSGIMHDVANHSWGATLHPAHTTYSTVHRNSLGESLYGASYFQLYAAALGGIRASEDKCRATGAKQESLSILSGFNATVQAAHNMFSQNLQLMREQLKENRLQAESIISGTSGLTCEYSTLEGTLSYIQANRPKVRSMKEALEAVDKM